LIRERRVETVPFAPLDSRLITKAKQRNRRRCKRDKRAGGSKQSGGPVGCEKQNSQIGSYGNNCQVGNGSDVSPLSGHILSHCDERK
jgi:hypothetical protein